MFQVQFYHVKDEKRHNILSFMFFTDKLNKIKFTLENLCIFTVKDINDLRV